MNSYEELEAEFNRRQMTGEPCRELVAEMLGALCRQLMEAVDEAERRLRVVH